MSDALSDSPAEAAERLALWVELSDRGLARIDYESVADQREVLRLLRDRGVTVKEIALQGDDLAGEIRRVLRELDELGAGSGAAVVSIDWWILRPGPASKVTDIETAAQMLNLQREPLARSRVRQLWWMTPSVRDWIVLRAPDLDSWFEVKLSVRSSTGSATEREGTSPSQLAAVLGGEIAARRDADHTHGFGTTRIRAGDLAQRAGDSDSALEHYRQSVAILESLARRDPGRADYERDLSVAYNKLGDVLKAMGEGERALEYYRKALAVAEKLAREEPGRADYQRDLSVSYSRLGDVLKAMGEGERALAHYRQALEIFEKLAWREPGRADYQRDLSVSYNKLGDVLRAMGEGARSLEYYRQSLEIFEKLARQEPARADYQRDLPVAYNKLGDVLGAMGEGERALEYYRQSLEIFEKLARQEPGRADYQRDLQISHERMGDVCRQSGKIEEMIQHFATALAIAERLAANEPGRADLQLSLVVPLTKLPTPENLTRALGILETLDSQGRLMAEHQAWIPMVREMVQRARETSASGS